MKNSYLLLLFFSSFGFAQIKNEFTAIDSKMSKIPDSLSQTTTSIAKFITTNFKSENDKIRAVFYWTASNISYDVEKIKTVEANLKARTSETTEEKLKTVFSTKKGVCIHYAEMFKAIANKLGIKTVIISGYTKQNGAVASLSHAWCACKIDGKWLLFDPTWGSGAVTSKDIFVKKLNSFYFKTKPEVLVKSHMPFDYLWQLLTNPISNQNFHDGIFLPSGSKFSFDFASEIQKYENLSDTEKAIQSLKRIEENGLINDLIKQEASDKKLVSTFENLSKITSDYNEAVAFFNDFVSFRNNQFKPTISDATLLEMIQKPKNIFLDCQQRSYKLGAVNQENIENVRSLKKAMI